MTLDFYVTKMQWADYKGLQNEDSRMPYLNATQEEAMEYCTAKGGRLPTNEELKDIFCPIWEWTNDFGVLRGGSFDNDALYLRSTYRYNDQPDACNVYIGFRCVLD